MAPSPVIRLHDNDAVLIARTTLLPGIEVMTGVVTSERIPAGHKVAIRPIATGEEIRRYGQIIGFATQPIAPGQHVHTQNMGMGDFDRDYAYGVDVKPTLNFDLPASFMGLKRSDGRVATRTISVSSPR
jgi:altronate hydrolase